VTDGLISVKRWIGATYVPYKTIGDADGVGLNPKLIACHVSARSVPRRHQRALGGSYNRRLPERISKFLLYMPWIVVIIAAWGI